ncbi:flagellar basal body-associated FliL family protein [Roseovarius salinarum]|uniref:flagellar basal body-associated FliL family protein n=1 Tax=Roseovarius salinarum TaxID=1981892 RepID=UPI000C3476DD|nr:flagellar basal body-associated FliL family protein [Roseovarius salinarum]
MIRRLLPVLLVLAGIGGGVSAGFALRPAPETATNADACACAGQVDTRADTGRKAAPETSGRKADREYVKLNNQFVVPLMEDDMVTGLVVLSLSVEVAAGLTETVYKREPKLRDAFLRVLFDHANMGGFRGAFTDNNKLDILRGALNDAALAVIGESVTDVLILDIARQDV